MKLRLDAGLKASFAKACRAWTARDGTRRLAARDAGLWTAAGEEAWLGWLDAPRAARESLASLEEIARDGRRFAHVLVLGMGGSSLAAEVQRAALGRRAGFPQLHVLDSIHPDAVARCATEIDPASTLVVVASKSGSTLEPNLLLAHFAELIERAVGVEEAPRRLMAITDPGSALSERARARGFRRVVAGEPTIGGRFSALSPFGLVPAALQGVELAPWVAAAERMAEACRESDPEANPGVALGLLLAAAALDGRDKLTLVLAPELAPLGGWLEQLVAESTGKRGRGILPFDGEELGRPEVYGDDRIFVAVRLRGELGAGDEARLERLAAAGQPVVEIDLGGPLALAGEFYRWEVATAVAGAELGINPFDQPDVESAKVEARRLASELERGGALPAEPPLAADEGCALFAPAAQRGLLLAAAGPSPTVEAVLAAHLARLHAGDYFALLAFCPPSAATVSAAARLRLAVRDARHVATAVGFGPRYLHSTGQAHKGGPPSGLFLLVTDRPRRDLPVPGQALGFAQAIAVQALGDFAVLGERGRRCLRVELRGPADELLPGLAARVVEELAT